MSPKNMEENKIEVVIESSENKFKGEFIFTFFFLRKGTCILSALWETMARFSL